MDNNPTNPHQILPPMKPSLHYRQMKRLEHKPKRQMIARQEKALVPHQGNTFVGAWDITEEELESIRAIWDECIDILPFCWPEHKTPCHEWVGVFGNGPWKRGKQGELTYGLFALGDKRYVYAHQLGRRLAGVLKAPETKANWVSGHSCDNKKCCNPDHLSWITYSQNGKQMQKSKKEGTYAETPYMQEKHRVVEAKKKEQDIYTNWLTTKEEK